MAWIASFTLCTLGDVMLGSWKLLPLFVVSFYGGTFIIASVTYPLLSSWRSWLKRRGLMAWYLVEVGGLWGGTMLMLLVLSPWWLRWSLSGTTFLQVLGWVLFVGSVVAGTWAVAKMGWARLLLAGALFPPGTGAEENGVPNRVWAGPHGHRTLPDDPPHRSYEGRGGPKRCADRARDRTDPGISSLRGKEHSAPQGSTHGNSRRSRAGSEASGMR